jgi:hypothetical protein
MSQFNWEILEVSSVNKCLKHIKYRVTLNDEDFKVVTEGYARFDLPSEVIFENVLEVELLEYLKRFYIQKDVNTIESRLSEQLAYLKKEQSTIPPWHIETFKVEV